MLRQRHPAGLYVLFFTEMWERFSFYTMLAIFVLYMTDPNNGHPFLRAHSSQIYGLYVGFVYFTPFFGGMLADRVLGYRNTVIAGAVVMGLGHVLLAVDQLPFFFSGLLGLVIGNGLFKPNISTLVGKLYKPGDPRIDNAYTIFYMGINIGACAAPLIAQYLRNKYSFHVAFGAAGVGMGISLVIFLLCQRWVRHAEEQVEQGEPPPGWSPSDAEPRPGNGEASEQLQTGSSRAGVNIPPRVATGPAALAVATTPATPPALVRADAAPEVPPDVQFRRHMALLIIFVIVAIFWMGFKQNGNTFVLWARDCTDRKPSESVLGVLQTLRLHTLVLDKEGGFSTELFSSVNGFFVVIFSPILVGFWSMLRMYRLEPPTPAKIGLGMVLAAAAFGILMLAGRAGGDMGVAREGKQVGQVLLATNWGDPTGSNVASGVSQGLAASDVGRVSAWNLIGAYAVITLAELFLSPMGLSLVSKLAAPKHRSTWMGGWFAATAIGGYLSGLVGGWWKEWLHSTFFGFLACTSLFAALLLLLSYRYLRRAMPAEKQE